MKGKFSIEIFLVFGFNNEQTLCEYSLPLLFEMSNNCERLWCDTQLDIYLVLYWIQEI